MKKAASHHDVALSEGGLVDAEEHYDNSTHRCFRARGCLLVTPGAAWAQQATGSIGGVVRDTSGAVLPGVTVEAASPALIEKVRTVVTDSQGLYQIVELRPGIYTVTFTLSGLRHIETGRARVDDRVHGDGERGAEGRVGRRNDYRHGGDAADRHAQRPAAGAVLTPDAGVDSRHRPAAGVVHGPSRRRAEPADRLQCRLRERTRRRQLQSPRRPARIAGRRRHERDGRQPAAGRRRLQPAHRSRKSSWRRAALAPTATAAARR